MTLQHIFSDHHFSTLFYNARVGIVLVNEDGGIEAVNKYVINEFGYTEEELIHQAIELLVPDRYKERHKSLRLAFVKHPASMAVSPMKEIKGLRKDETEFNVEISLGFYKTEKTIFFIAFLNNLSNSKEAEATIEQLRSDLDQRVKESTRSLHATVEQLSRQIKENERKDAELQLALEKEKELNQLKSRFVSIASHEFRTPLSGILASTYLLSKYTHEVDQPQRDKHIRRIMTSVNLLNEVLGDFLSVDKMEQENFKPNLTEFDINELVEEVIQSMQHMLKTGQQIKYELKSRHKIVYLDQSMFQHILSNLLSNAIKYAPEHSDINLIIELRNQALTVIVKDKGIGIPVQEQKDLYKRFYRGSNAAHIQGTGLGLNIVKKYVDVLDGRIECHSAENEGTEFILRFKNQKESYEENSGS